MCVKYIKVKSMVNTIPIKFYIDICFVIYMVFVFTIAMLTGC